MIKNIEALTTEEYLRQQIKDGKIPTCPIRAGERIKFGPNEITIKQAHEQTDKMERNENGYS